MLVRRTTSIHLFLGAIKIIKISILFTRRMNFEWCAYTFETLDSEHNMVAVLVYVL